MNIKEKQQLKEAITAMIEAMLFEPYATPKQERYFWWMASKGGKSKKERGAWKKRAEEWSSATKKQGYTGKKSEKK